MPLTLRPALANDKLWVKELQFAAYRDLVLLQFGVWDPSDQTARFEEKWVRREYQIISSDDLPIGALWVSLAPDHMFLNEIQLLPDHQGAGVGSRVIDELLEKAASLGLPVRLRVLLRNRARSLYERLGFRVHDCTDTHHLMQWSPKARD